MTSIDLSVKGREYEEIYKAVLLAVRSCGFAPSCKGASENVFIFTRLSELFKVGSILFDQGFIVTDQALLARQKGLSRQAISNAAWRDGTGVFLAVDDYKGLFRVDKVN